MIDQTSLFECITSGVYEYDEEYWMDISDQGKTTQEESNLMQY